MSCTTILVGKNASFDGSTIIARNEDCPSGEFCEKRFSVSNAAGKKTYKSVIGHLEVPLPDGGGRYTCMPNADLKEGLWEAAGVNAHNVAMTATETLTTNERVLAADPLVAYKAAVGEPGQDGYEAEQVGGIGEEDMVTLVLPYATSARDGVLRLGALLERYGTYEMNGIAFSDVDEIWWLETVGGHHWIARRVPDDCYVTMPNQLGLDSFDLDDALGEGREHLCSPDLREFIQKNHLDLSLDGELNPRDAFGSRSDADHVYGIIRAWDGGAGSTRPPAPGRPRRRTRSSAPSPTACRGAACLSARLPSRTSSTCSASTTRARSTTPTATSAPRRRAVSTAPSASTATASSPSCRSAPTSTRSAARCSGSRSAATRSTRSCPSSRRWTRCRRTSRRRPGP